MCASLSFLFLLIHAAALSFSQTRVIDRIVPLLGSVACEDSHKLLHLETRIVYCTMCFKDTFASQTKKPCGQMLGLNLPANLPSLFDLGVPVD